MDSYARTDTQIKNTSKHKTTDTENGKNRTISEKCMQQLKAQKPPGVSYPMNSKGGAGCGLWGNFSVQLRK